MVKVRKVNKPKESALKNFLLMKNPVENVLFIVGLLILIPLLILPVLQGGYPNSQKISGLVSFFVPNILTPIISLWILSKLFKAPASFFLALGLGPIIGFIIIVNAFFVSNSYVLALITVVLIISVLLKYCLKTSWQKAALIGIGTATISFLVNQLVSVILY